MVRRKSMKVSNTAKEPINDDDRFTHLPDDLIRNIYSLIDSRSFVQSSLLSRRWRDTWKSHPYLKFKIDPSTGNKFPNFVHRFLCNRDKNAEISAIDFLSNSIPLRLLKEVVTYSMLHKTRKLNIEYLSSTATRRGGFDISLFKSKFLQDLGLRIDFELLKAPNLTWDLPALTTLHLERVTFTLYPPSNDGSTGNKSIELFSNLANLKTLNLVGCRLQYIHTFHITSSGLENLTLSRLFHSCEQFVISAPKLSSFTYELMAPTLILANDLNSLETLSFRTIYDTTIGNQPKFVEFMFNTFHQLYKAKHLTLNPDALLFLSKFDGLLEKRACPFVRLESLTLDEIPSFPVDFADIISYFRSSSPGCVFEIEYYRALLSNHDMGSNQKVIIRMFEDLSSRSIAASNPIIELDDL